MAVLGTPSVSLEERKVQQWSEEAGQGASARGWGRVGGCFMYNIKDGPPPSNGTPPGRVLITARGLGEAWSG